MDGKHDRPLLLQKRGHRLTEENPRKVLVPEERVLLERKAAKCAKSSSEEHVRGRRVFHDILPYVSITSLNPGANVVTVVKLDTLRVVGSPVKSQRKVVGKDQLPY